MNERREFWRGTRAAFSVLSVGYLPVLLLGVFAVELEADLGLTPVEVGWAIAVFWIANAVVVPLGGHRADREGWVRFSAAVVTVSGAVLVLLGSAVGSLPPLVVAMELGVAGMALCSQSSNLTVSREVPWGLQGRAFGIKQASPPAMALVAGLLAVTVVVPFG